MNDKEKIKKEFFKWREKIKKEYKPVACAKFILIGGQPGSGKSSLVKKVENKFNNNIVKLDIDEYTKWHPKYNEYQKINSELGKNPNNQKLTEKSNNLIREIRSDIWPIENEMIEWLAENKYNFLLDQTLGGDSIDFNIQTINKVKEKGIETEVHCLAVNELVSKLGVFYRYENQLEEDGMGRMVPLDYQEKSYKKIPENLEKLLKTGATNSVYLYQKLYHGEPKILEPIKISDYTIVKEIMFKIRTSNFSDKEINSLNNWVKTIEDKIKKRNGNIKSFHRALKNSAHKSLSYKQQINLIISGNSKSIKK